jgi:hypothetical protein
LGLDLRCSFDAEGQFLFRGGAAGRWNRIVSVEQLVRRLLSELAGYIEWALIGIWLHVVTGYMD